MTELPQTAPSGPVPPKVLPWYKAYAIAMFIVYILIVVGLAAGLILAPEGFRQELDMPQWFFIGYVIMIFGLSSLMAAAFGVALFLPPKPWTWVYHLVMICMGLTSPCCMPASIPLLIFWIKDDSRHYFGRK